MLSDFQMGRTSWPDLVHQAAHAVAAREVDNGRENVSVYVHAIQSIHGRAWQAAIDPDVDLAATPRTCGPKSWVMPFKEPYPPPPAAASAFLHAKWRFCKAENLLPFSTFQGDEEMARRVANWEHQYRSALRAGESQQ